MRFKTSLLLLVLLICLLLALVVSDNSNRDSRSIRSLNRRGLISEDVARRWLAGERQTLVKQAFESADSAVPDAAMSSENDSNNHPTAVPPTPTRLIATVDTSSADQPVDVEAVTLTNNIRSGERIFFENQQTNCGKCHAVGGRGGHIGPELTEIGKKPLAEIRQSVIEPSGRITLGYETRLIQTIDGLILTGIVKENSEEKIVLMDADGNLTTVLQDDVEETQPGLSAMPSGVAEVLTPAQLRDLLAYLQSLKGNE